MLGRFSPGLRHVSKLRAMSTSAVNARRLEGKVAIVTASTDGIGLAIARRLGQEGAKVMVSSRKQENVDAAVKQLREEELSVSGIVCHVGKAGHRTQLIQKTVDTYGGIDIVVSNAAANPQMGPILETTEEQWDKIFDINVKSAFFLVKEAVPHMEKRGGGSVIFVSSIGAYQPFELIAPYAVSKTTLLGLTKAMVMQLSPLKIRVNGIAPGIIKTSFSSALWSSPEAEKRASKQTPMNRLGESHECAGAVAFLASEDASYITGETICMTGGMMSRL